MKSVARIIIGTVLVCASLASCTASEHSANNHRSNTSSKVLACKANELTLSVVKTQHGGFELLGMSGNELVGLLIRIQTKKRISCILDAYLFPQFMGQNQQANKMLIQQNAPWQPLGLKPVQVNHGGDASFVLAYPGYSTPPLAAAHTIWAKIPCIPTTHIQFELSFTQPNTLKKSNIVILGLRPKDVPSWTACPPIALATAPEKGMTGGGVWPPRPTPLPPVPTTTVLAPPAIGTAACSASQIVPTGVWESDNMGEYSVYFYFENVSESPCSLGGYPGITFLDQFGNAMFAKQYNDLPNGATDGEFELKPKEVFSNYIFLSAGNQSVGGPACPTATTILFSVPGGSGTVRVVERPGLYWELCKPSFGASSVAPGQMPTLATNLLG